ncbi:MAG: efflux RND transporter periplasmic adaptor subunit [gamma proteobacterium symbiont of Bathyaustriella thionipta]|nr:efflux RND transporter periplasmic adaptor subunit [gamma proteobacterium symbiont of Bathyaustriella thionipta]
MSLGKYTKIVVGACLLLSLSLSQALETVPVIHKSMIRHFYLDGIVEAVNQTTVSAQTSGKIEAILFDVDDYVIKDSLILSLNNTEQRANVKKSEAAIQEAKALNLKARQEYTRIKIIYEKKLLSKSSMDEAQAQLHATKARLDAAQAGLTQAREQLSYTQVLAPYSGIVIERHVEPGEVVQPGIPLVTGISLDHLRVNVDVPQSLISKLRQYSKASILLPGSNQVVAAQNITIFPFADPYTNTFQVRLDLPVGLKQLFPGMFVKVSLVTGQKQKLMVPAKAVVYRSEVTGVYVKGKNGRISFRQIRSGGENGEQTIVVLAGLDEGELVVLDPIAAGALLIKQRKATQSD